MAGERPKDVMYIRNYESKDGEERSDWMRVGVCWGTNKDGSQNFEFTLPIVIQPGMKFQIRARKDKESDAQGKGEEGGW